MSGSVEIVLWLHEYELKALEKQLASNGTDVEKRMQKMLADLYSECVPFEERQAIQERINAEHAEAVADQMANTTWAAYHITGHGEDLYFKTSKADTLLVAAKRLRTYLTAEDNPQPVSFAAVLKDRTEITQAEYDQLLDQRLQNTGKVSGVFEMDFDRDTFSAANAMDGWHTYRIHDVSVAAYPDAVIVQEVFTRTRLDRPEWLKLMRRIQPGDEIVFDSVSRMSGDAKEGFAAYEELYQKGVNLVYLKDPHINTETYKKALENNIQLTGSNVDYILEGVNRYLLELAKEQIRLAFEQSEKEVQDLHQRTREGIETARLNGKQIGRQKNSIVVTRKSIESKEVIKKTLQGIRW